MWELSILPSRTSIGKKRQLFEFLKIKFTHRSESVEVQVPEDLIDFDSWQFVAVRVHTFTEESSYLYVTIWLESTLLTQVPLFLNSPST